MSKNPGKFAACVRNFNRNGGKLMEETHQSEERSQAQDIQESPAKDQGSLLFTKMCEFSIKADMRGWGFLSGVGPQFYIKGGGFL